MLVGPSDDFDFEMIFFNSDGLPAEMCGNGGRCITAMASQSGIIGKKTVFLTTDGPHEAEVTDRGLVRLKMIDVADINSFTLPPTGFQTIGPATFLNTGVPHLVVFVNELNSLNVDQEGRKLRYLDQFSPAGTNINFVKADGSDLQVRTYERGVEGETLACGTGNVAAAIAAEWTHNTGLSEYNCQAVGGHLKVAFSRSGVNKFTDVWLEGPAVKVFEGVVEVQE
jgi:diaminopimelate epimerase